MTHDPKSLARRLRVALAARGTDVTHSTALELVAQAHGHRDWNTMAAAPDPTGPPRTAIPILRIFDPAKAYEFYRDFLGFTVLFEHRFADHLPLYAGVSRDGVQLHLSEHHGDATPGSAVIVEVADAVALQRELLGKDYAYATPGVEQEDWGLVVTVHDPFGNRIMFRQRPEPSAQTETGRPAEHAGPIVHTRHVDASPDVAFEALTRRFSQWWDPRLTADPDTFTGVRIDPRPGGEVAFEHSDGTTYSIGQVTVWEPGERYAQSFTLALDAEYPTSLTVEFVPDGDGTLVTLTHGGWSPGNVAERAKFTEWQHLLERFAAVSEGSA